MDTHEITLLIRRLQGFYGDRFPGLTLDMAEVWIQELQPWPWDLAQHALRQWVKAHLAHQVPTLDQLVASIEDLQAERRRTQAAAGQRPVWPENDPRNDAYSTAEVRALIRSVWPEMYAEPTEAMKEEARVARITHLKQQVAELLAEERG